jgi:hypothetical protein
MREVLIGQRNARFLTISCLLHQLRSNVAFAVKQNAWEILATLGLLLIYVARITIKS